MIKMIRELDWKTPLMSVDVGRHWRIVLCVIIFAMLAAVLLQSVFPNTNPFLKLWTGCVTGGVIGVLVGFFWQIRSMERRNQTTGIVSSSLLVAWGSFACLGFLFLIPQMADEEAMRTKIRLLSIKNLKSVRIGSKAFDVENPDDVEIIEKFCHLARKAKLFKSSHEGSYKEFELSLKLADGEELYFPASIPKRHLSDLSLEFRSASYWTEILIPDGRSWL